MASWAIRRDLRVRLIEVVDLLEAIVFEYRGVGLGSEVEGAFTKLLVDVTNLMALVRSTGQEKTSPESTETGSKDRT